jgi:hypothetical protein
VCCGRTNHRSLLKVQKDEKVASSFDVDPVAAFMSVHLEYEF